MSERAKKKNWAFSKRKKNFAVDSYIEESKVKYAHLKAQKFILQLFSFEALIEEGKLYFMENLFDKAIYKFLDALSIFKDRMDKFYISTSEEILLEVNRKSAFTSEEVSLLKPNFLKCYLNLSACFLKISNFQNALKFCNEALTIDPNNVKALYRRSISRKKLNENDLIEIKLSILDLKRALQIDPNNSEISALLLQFKKDYSEQKKKEINKNDPGINEKDSPIQNANQQQEKSHSIVQEMKKLGYECVSELDKLQEIIDKGKDALKEYRRLEDQDKINQCIVHINRLEFIRDYFIFLINVEKIPPSEQIKDKLASLGLDISNQLSMDLLVSNKKQIIEEIKDITIGEIEASQKYSKFSWNQLKKPGKNNKEINMKKESKEEEKDKKKEDLSEGKVIERKEQNNEEKKNVHTKVKEMKKPKEKKVEKNPLAIVKKEEKKENEEKKEQKEQKEQKEKKEEKIDLERIQKLSEMMDEGHCFERWFFSIIVIIFTLYSFLIMGKTITGSKF